MWLARDSTNMLYLYEERPCKWDAIWAGNYLYAMDSNLFPEVQWTDEEPTEVEITIKKK